MTEEPATELGKRAVAAGWQWQPGACTTSGDRACAILRFEALWMSHAVSTRPAWGDIRPYHIPDFRDPPTLGILRAQVVALVPGAVDVFAEWLEPYQKAAVFFVDAHGKPTTKHANEPVWQPAIVPCTTASLWPAGALVACLEAAKAGEL